MYYDKLKNQLFVEIDYPKNITDLIGEADPWKEFCNLPQEIKSKFDFEESEVYGDSGYKLRAKKEGREDKEYFHIYPNIFSLIDEKSLRDLVEANIVLKNFFNYSHEVYARAHEFAVSIANKMAKEIPKLTEATSKDHIRSLLRLLHYTNADNEEIIASQHFDRSLYTLHLYENAPGLQFLNWDMKWIDAPIEKGKTVVFNGYRIEKLSQGKLQKTWHRVVKAGDHRDRISLVLFVWTDLVADYSKSERAQNLTPSYIHH